jgi:fructose-1,6-bisphosphatase/inositol monophosphatase family enzyme
MAAGVLLITEAGGLVSDFEGGEKFLETGNIVCGNRCVALTCADRNVSRGMRQLLTRIG